MFFPFLLVSPTLHLLFYLIVWSLPLLIPKAQQHLAIAFLFICFQLKVPFSSCALSTTSSPDALSVGKTFAFAVPQKLSFQAPLAAIHRGSGETGGFRPTHYWLLLLFLALQIRCSSLLWAQIWVPWILSLYGVFTTAPCSACTICLCVTGLSEWNQYSRSWQSIFETCDDNPQKEWLACLGKALRKRREIELSLKDWQCVG